MGKGSGTTRGIAGGMRVGSGCQLRHLGRRRV
jgi:hypothetical protein